MELMDAALGSLSLASSGQLTQYSMRLARDVMDTETQTAAQLLDMLPQQQSFQPRGPQPGDVPAVARGSFLDTYA